MRFEFFMYLQTAETVNVSVSTDERRRSPDSNDNGAEERRFLFHRPRQSLILGRKELRGLLLLLVVIIIYNSRSFIIISYREAMIFQVSCSGTHRAAYFPQPLRGGETDFFTFGTFIVPLYLCRVCHRRRFDHRFVIIGFCL